MKQIFTLFVLFVFFVSCEEHNETVPDDDAQIVKTIASSDEYRNVKVARQNIFQAMIDRKFDARQISDEIKRNPDYTGFCSINTANYKSEGIELYKELNCQQKQSRDALHERFPSYSSLSAQRKAEIRTYFDDHFKQTLPELILPTKNK